jgi:hypothetical protein
VHAFAGAAAHFVPKISRHLELGALWHFDLGERKEVIEASFARDFLLEKPFHLVAGRVLGEKREEWIALTWSRFP